MLKAFIQAARLRTLPLSVSGIIVGASLGNHQYECFMKAGINCCFGTPPVISSLVFWLAILTTIGFQVLSNFANDYGDGIRGTDSNRTGEQRLVASGIISPKQMRLAMLITASLTLVTALALIFIAFKDQAMYSLIFFLLGIASIVAAVKYTVGKKAYGYSGFGDLFVFLFFGLLSVVGSYFLYVKQIHWLVFLPAITVGLLSVAVLNLNNMRDRIEDSKHDKKTLAVKLGSQGSKAYHYCLLLGALISSLLYIYFTYQSLTNFICLLAFIPIVHNLKVVAKNTVPSELDSELKKVALSTFAFAILFAIFN